MFFQSRKTCKKSDMVSMTIYSPVQNSVTQGQDCGVGASNNGWCFPVATSPALPLV